MFDINESLLRQQNSQQSPKINGSADISSDVVINSPAENIDHYKSKFESISTTIPLKNPECSTKRKKTKTKITSTAPITSSKAATTTTATTPQTTAKQYAEKSLDDWLDSCLKDGAPLTLSSSEFLDHHHPQASSVSNNPFTLKLENQQQYRPKAGGSGSSGAMNSSNSSTRQSTQRPGLSGATMTTGIGGNIGISGIFETNQPTFDIPDPYRFQKYFQYPSMQQGNYGGASLPNHQHNMMMMLNGSGGGSGVGIGEHQNLHGPLAYTNLNSDFASLPPAIDLMNSNKKDLRIDAQDILDALDYKHLSEPCLAAVNSDNDSKESGAGGDGNGQGNHQQQQQSKIDSNKMLATILQQINVIHDTNSKICRNLRENKVDIEALKHAPNWGLRHRRDSISGLSTHSQPMGGFATFGAQSPAPTYHSGAYTPGMMTDVVREVKDAARVREEALLGRVRAMVEERSWGINDMNLKLVRDHEDMKIQLNQMKTERHETLTHISKMEDEIKSLKSILSHILNQRSGPETVHLNGISLTGSPPISPEFLDQSGLSHKEHEFMTPLPYRQYHGQNHHQHQPQLSQSTKSSKFNLNLKYGVITHDNESTEDDLIRPMNTQFNDIRKTDKLKYTQNQNGKQQGQVQRSSSPQQTMIGNHHNQQQQTPQKHSNSLNSSFSGGEEIDQLELRRELQTALVGRKHAEQKIVALEDALRKLRKSIIQPENVGDGRSSSSSETATTTVTNLLYNSNTNNHNNNQSASVTANSSRNLSISDNQSSTTTSVKQISINPQNHHHHNHQQQQLHPLQQQQQQHQHTPKLNNSNISLLGPVTDL